LNIINYYIVAATRLEIQASIAFCEEHYNIQSQDAFFIAENIIIHFCITGVSVASTIYHLTKIAQQPVNLIIQAGIAGSFKHQLNIGNVYCIGADRFADIGVQDNEQFIDAYTMQLIDGNAQPFTNGWLFNTQQPYPTFFNGLMHVNAITVNTVSGNAATIEKLNTLYKPSIESMEGAALHYVCLQENIPFVQLRAVSNYVEIRDKSKWNIPLAVENLNIQLIEFIKTLQA
jgi:futalosine hydrolase